MRKYRASRFKQLIFPQELIIDKFHVLSRKRHFPAFWRVTEESIPLSKLASIQVYRGLFFSKILIENSGGPYPIILDGLWNKTAGEARDLLEMIEREMQRREDITGLVGDVDEDGGGGPPDVEDPGPLGSCDPESLQVEGQPVHVSSDYRPHDIHDKTELEAIAREIVDEDKCKPTDTPSAMAAHFESLKAMKASLEPPSTNPPGVLQPAGEAPGTKRLGEVPNGWNPPVPWAPRRKPESEKVEKPGYPEVNPIEFLNREVETITAVDEKQRDERKARSTGKLVDWWKQTSDEHKSGPSRSRREKRKLQ